MRYVSDVYLQDTEPREMCIPWRHAPAGGELLENKVLPAETIRMTLMSSAPRRTRLSSAAMRPRGFRHCHVIRSYSILFPFSSLNSLPK